MLSADEIRALSDEELLRRFDKIDQLDLESEVVSAQHGGTGEERVVCATQNVIMVKIRFKQAPDIGVAFDVPKMKWNPNLIPGMGMKAVPQLVRALMEKAHAVSAALAAADDKPRLVLPDQDKI